MSTLSIPTLSKTVKSLSQDHTHETGGRPKTRIRAALGVEGTKTIREQRVISRVLTGQMINNGPSALEGMGLDLTLLGRDGHVRSRVSPDVFQRVEFLEHLVALDFFGHVYGHCGFDTQTNDQNNNKNNGTLGRVLRG